MTDFTAIPKIEGAPCLGGLPRQVGTLTLGLAKFPLCSQLCSPLAACNSSVCGLVLGISCHILPQPRLYFCGRKDQQREALCELPQHHLPSHLAVGAPERCLVLKPFWPGHRESNCKIRIIIKKNPYHTMIV